VAARACTRGAGQGGVKCSSEGCVLLATDIQSACEPSGAVQKFPAAHGGRSALRIGGVDTRGAPRCPARWAILIQLRRSISCAWRFPRRLSTELTRSLFISRWSCNSSLGAVVHTRALRWSLPGAGPCWRDCATSPVSVRRSLRSAGPRRDTSRPLLGRPRLAGGGCTQCRPRRPHRSHGTDGSEGMSHFTLERRHAWHARRAYGFILIQ